MSKIGAHVSAAGSVALAPDNAKELGAEVFQFFSRSPRGGKAKEITNEIANEFKAKCKEYGMEGYIHAPYYINFPSSNNRISYGSVAVIREELQRGSKLGVKYMMTHLGSAKDLGDNAAIKQTINRIKAIFEKGEKFSTQLLLENSAGSKGVVGDTFEELAEVIDGVGRDDIGVCLDTCHLFASGYDIRTADSLKEVLKKFKKLLPLSKIKLIHANDSKVDLDARVDRHENIGDGKLGIETFKNLLSDSVIKKVNFVLEIPGGGDRMAKDIQKLKDLRN